LNREYDREKKKKESVGGREKHYTGEARNNISGFGGSQVMTTSPSGRGNAYDRN
jgi:hypothetical protein